MSEINAESLKEKLADIVGEPGVFSEEAYLLNLIVALEKCSEPLFSYEPPFKKIMSPMCGDFGHWQNMISGQLDPNKTSDTGRYLGEEEFDMSDLPKKQVARLKELFEKYKWVDGHPPE